MANLCNNLITGRQLRAARVLAGLTQRSLGAALGVDERQVRFWERRHHSKPSGARHHMLLVAITFATEALTSGPVSSASRHASRREAFAESSRRNAEVLQAMSMSERMADAWALMNADQLQSQQRASDVAGALGALSKVLRMMLQSAVLGLGAYLVIQQQATAGVIIAAAILTSRALAPVELAIAHWKGFVAARQSWQRLKEALGALPARPALLHLPSASKSLSVEAVSVVPPGSQTVIVKDVSFRLEAGQALGVIGPSASGKSTLARSLVGAWAAAKGKVRLDDAALEQWPFELLGAQIGYLPQTVELFDETIALNIARFDREAEAARIIEAATAAGVHELVQRMPDGYQTRIGEGGAALSAGQRQRIGLARALYGNPFLVVLDEPNSNLDADGDAALTEAILRVRARGGIVIVIAHRPSALAAVDLVLVLADGKVQTLGPKEEVMARALRPVGPSPKPTGPLKVVTAAAGGEV